jgi:hypothetical protein
MVTATGPGSSVSSLESLAPPIQPIQTLLVSVIAREREDVDVLETNKSAPLSWGEFEAFPESYTPPTSGLEPAFAQFLGGLIKKAKKVAQNGVELAKKGLGALTRMGLDPILRRLKELVRPLLQRVIKTGIGKQAGRQRLVKYPAPVAAWDRRTDSSLFLAPLPTTLATSITNACLVL